MMEQEWRDIDRETDQAAKLQSNVMLAINGRLFGYRTKICFSYYDDDETL